MWIQIYHAMRKVFRALLASAFAVVFSVSAMAQQHKIAVAAHRGFWNCEEAGYAQNSIKALALAQENGFWGSEFDVQLTSDDVPIVNHDNSYGGVKIWDNPFSAFKDMTLKNGERIPTLDEYLTQGEKSKSTILVFELKEQKDEAREDKLVELSLKALKEHNLYNPSRVIFISFSIHMCREIAKLAPEFTNQYLGSDISPDELAKDGINGVDYHYSNFYSKPWYEQARNHSMSINAWTVDGKEDIQKMIDLGVDCITTNVPLTVREMLGKNEDIIPAKGLKAKKIKSKRK